MSLRTSTANPSTLQVDNESAIQPQNNSDSTDEHRDLYENSTNSSPPAAENPAQPTFPVLPVAQAHDMQSPQARGVLAPPPTPQTPSVKDVAGKDINDHASDTSSEFSTLGTFTLGESRYATDKKTSLLGPARAMPDVIVAHAPRSSQLTPEQRKARDQSFARMSFITAVQPPTISEEPSEIKADPKPTVSSTLTADPKPTVAAKLAADSKLAAWKLASDLKEAEERSAVNEKSVLGEKPVVKSQETFMDNWMSKSGSPGIKKAAVSENDTKAPANDRPRTPPHLRAAKPTTILTSVDINKPVTSGEPTTASVTDRPVTPPHLRAAKHAVFTPETFHVAVQADLAAKAAKENMPPRSSPAAQAAKTDETLKHAVTFQAWPKAQGRDQPSKRISAECQDQY